MYTKSFDEINVEQELLVQRELLKVMAEHRHQSVLDYNADEDTFTAYDVVNGQYVPFMRQANYVSGEMIGAAYIAPEDREAYRKAFLSCLRKPSHTILDLRCLYGENRREWCRIYLVSVSGEQKKVTKVAGCFVSIQGDRIANERNRKKDGIDPMTGLYNRSVFDRKCMKALEKHRGDGFLVVISINDFKKFMDDCGPEVGEEVLFKMGDFLVGIAGAGGITGRLRGDEFAAFFWGYDKREQIDVFCRKLQREIYENVLSSGCTVSIGIAVCTEETKDFNGLHFEASRAINEIRISGRDGMLFADEITTNPLTSESHSAVTDSLFDKVDDRKLLTMYGKCMKLISGEEYWSGTKKVLNELLGFYDADVVVLLSWDKVEESNADEAHNTNAEELLQYILRSIDGGNELGLMEITDKNGLVLVRDVESLREFYPESYRKLSEAKIWSVLAQELKVGEISNGIIIVYNPRKSVEEWILLRMLSFYLATRLMHQQIQEVREYEISHDRLTGLLNRNSFMMWEGRLKENEHKSMGIVTTDIVGLAEVNRNMGFLAGDRKLVEAATTIQSVFMGFRIVRYEEDEMLVVCPNIEKRDFEFLVESLREKLAELDWAVALGYSWSSNVHIMNQIAESEVVMNNDKLMLLNGKHGKERREQIVIDEIHQMIEAGNYLVYLQPKVNIQTEKTVGAEALVRMVDPELGMVSPAVFIPVLERYNLINLVDMYVLEEVFRFQRAAIDEGRETLPISVNFSKLTILQPELLPQIRELVDKYELPDGLIHIEVTETLGDMDHVVVERVSDALKVMGFKLSMDDFGTHYSNLAVLIQYDFDSVKIDRSMVTEITTN